MRTLAYALLPVLVLLIGMEGLARVLHLGGIVLHPNAASCLQRSPLLGQEFRPSCGAIMTDKAFRTNELGLRDGPIVQDGRTRVLAIGDSCTFGWGVEQTEAYPQVLQGLLDARRTTPGYRVINAGVPGYTSYHGVLYLRERGLALRPAIVIAGYGFNDIFRTGDVVQALRWQRALMPLLELDDALLDRSRMWLWVRAKTAMAPRDDLPFRSTPERYRRNLVDIVEMARAAGVKPLLVSFWRPNAPQQQHAAAVGEVAREHGVPMVTYVGDRLDVVHPTRDGYAGLARDVLARLDEAGYLAP